MKKSIIALLMLAPMAAMAQNTWEVPSAQQTEQVQKKALFEKKKKTIDKKYLAGAVPVVDGKVTFTLDKDFAGKSADEIYGIVYSFLEKMTQQSNQVQNIDDKSKIALINKGEHTIAAKFKEWLVFKNTICSIKLLSCKCSSIWINNTLIAGFYKLLECRKRVYEGLKR